MNVKMIVMDKLKKITQKNCNIDSNVFDLGIDSLDLLLLVTDIEKYFKIAITDEEITQIKYIKDIINIIENKINNFKNK